jgi:hypothetical protein
MQAALVFLIVSMFPAVMFGQAPEFMQQYTQRLGGAIDELQLIVQHFEDDARRSGIGRSDALQLMARNPEQLVRDQSVRMQETIGRLQRLQDQQVVMRQGSITSRFVYFVSNYDRPLAARTWENYQGGLQLSFDGIVFALMGFALSFVTLCAAGLGLRAMAKA